MREDRGRFGLVQACGGYGIVRQVHGFVNGNPEHRAEGVRGHQRNENRRFIAAAKSLL